MYNNKYTRQIQQILLNLDDLLLQIKIHITQVGEL